MRGEGNEAAKKNGRVDSQSKRTFGRLNAPPALGEQTALLPHAGGRVYFVNPAENGRQKEIVRSIDKTLISL